MVAVLGMQSACAILGVLIGLIASCILATWHSRDIWGKIKSSTGNFNSKYWLRRIIPLTFGLGAGQFMLSADMLAARSILSGDESGTYGAAGMIGRGLVIFTAPLAAVMFPKIASSSDQLKLGILRYTVSRTATLCIFVCVTCTLTAWLLPSITENISTLAQRQNTITEITKIIPYFIWSMFPLTLANVYIAALLAKEKYKGIPLLILIAFAYAIALIWLSNKANTPSSHRIILTIGAFNLLYLAATKCLSRQLNN